MNYEEYLKENGASEEEIKVLNVPSARKAFDKMIADSEKYKADAAKAVKEKVDYEAEVEKWHAEKIVPEYERMKNEALTAKGREAAARAILEQAQKDGLIDVAKTMGWDKEKIEEKKEDKNVNSDLSKYMTKEEVVALAQNEGEAIAMVADMVAEHQQLFPGTRLNVRELRKEAQGRRISVEKLWEEKYKIPEARAAADLVMANARDEKIRKEEREKVSSEFASKYGNPDVRPLSPSKSPLTLRPETGRDKAPWETGDKTNDRVSRATASVIKQFSN